MKYKQPFKFIPCFQVQVPHKSLNDKVLNLGMSLDYGPIS